MNKQATIKAISDAKDTHLKQMDKIAMILKGKDVESPTAVLPTKCEFGKWLYGDSENLKVILGSHFYSTLEELHGQWHDEYKRVFELCFQNRKKGFFAKLTGSDKLDDMTRDKVDVYYVELKKTTQELLKIIASSQRRMEALPESKFS